MSGGTEKFLPFSVYINVEANLFITGGKLNEECVPDFYFFNSEKNQITKLKNMLVPRCSHSMIYLPSNNTLYAVGGYSNRTSEKYCIADKTDKKWVKMANLNFHEKQVPTLFCLNNRYIICIIHFY